MCSYFAMTLKIVSAYGIQTADISINISPIAISVRIIESYDHGAMSLLGVGAFNKNILS